MEKPGLPSWQLLQLRSGALNLLRGKRKCIGVRHAQESPLGWAERSENLRLPLGLHCGHLVTKLNGNRRGGLCTFLVILLEERLYRASCATRAPAYPQRAEEPPCSVVPASF